MLVLLTRAITLSLLVFLVLRFTGKRQLGELQPFDLVLTLLIADFASVPATDTGVPLLYGIVPICAMFLLHQLVSFLSLKSEEVRGFVCGKCVLLVARGVVLEDALRVTRFTLNDLMAQLRSKDVFNLSDVAFAVLETNGELSVLLRGDIQQPTYASLALPPADDVPPLLLIQDGKIHREALRQAGRNESWLRTRLELAGCQDESAAFYALLDSSGALHVQTTVRTGARRYTVDDSGARLDK